MSFGLAFSRRVRGAYCTGLYYYGCRYPRVILRHPVSCAVDTMPMMTFTLPVRRRTKYGTRRFPPAAALRRSLHHMYYVRSTSTRPSGVGAGECYGKQPRGEPRRCFDPRCFRVVLSVCSLDCSVRDCVIAERFRFEILTYTNLSKIYVFSILRHQIPITFESGRLDPIYTTTCIDK